MGYKDLHDEPFDFATISKLEIFEDYAQAWIPTFVMQERPTICIFDFFAGTGYDLSGVPGSPIRILNKINDFIDLIEERNVKIKLFLNEYEPNKKNQDKFELLKNSCSEYLNENERLKKVIILNYENEDFESLFPKLLKEINSYPSLVYLDQNGIKFLSDKYFLELEKTKETDFLYFVSASYFWRFGDRKEFKVHLDLDMELAKKDPYKFIHRNLLAQLKHRLPIDTKLKLYPFSLKKGNNIHGIIFGATHIRAVDKFLTISWSKNEKNGEANFDIDDDDKKAQLDMFLGQRLSKVDAFKQRVKEKIKNKEIGSNFQLYDYVMQEGHICKHAFDCLKEMKDLKQINYKGTSPLISYENVYKYKRLQEYFLLTKN